MSSGSKILMLLRHGKSSWDDASVGDHDRPLNKRGRKSAKQVGKMLHDACLAPVLIVSSTALRARKTAEKVAKHSGYPRAIDLVPELYLAPPAAYLEVAKNVMGDPASVMLIGHNPGISDLLAQWSPATGAMPTAALAVIELELASWKKLKASTTGKLILYWTPERE